MSFAVSLGDGAFEYAGNGVASLLAQKQNLLRPRFWSMLYGILRFYRQAPRDIPRLANSDLCLGDYLRRANSAKPSLATISCPWPAPSGRRRPRLCSIIRRVVHQLLRQSRPAEAHGRPPWRTVEGGSKTYVAKLTGASPTGCASGGSDRDPCVGDGVRVRDASGASPSSMMWSSPPMPTKRFACSSMPRRRAPRLAPSATAAISRCSTPTRASCRNASRCGRAGTISVPRPIEGTRSASPIG